MLFTWIKHIPELRNTLSKYILHIQLSHSSQLQYILSTCILQIHKTHLNCIFVLTWIIDCEIHFSIHFTHTTKQTNSITIALSPFEIYLTNT